MTTLATEVDLEALSHPGGRLTPDFLACTPLQITNHGDLRSEMINHIDSYTSNAAQLKLLKQWLQPGALPSNETCQGRKEDLLIPGSQQG